MPVEWLNDGGAVVTLDPPVWTPLDVFTWVAFGERRIGADHLFTFAEWSLDWGHWPPQSLDRAFHEVASGVPWQPVPDSWEAGWADKDRAWARNIMECTGASALELGWVLDADILLFRNNEARYHVAKAEVMAAIRDGRLPVWARKAHGSARPNYDAAPELLDHRLFTHDESREVNEGAWVDGAGDYKGPWWDQVRFDADRVRAIWTARPSAGISSFFHSFPAVSHIPPWDCVCWRAFGTLNIPRHIAHHRSFDGGDKRFPDESEARYAARQAEHRRFDAAEREVMDLLASGRISAKGQPPAERDGKQLQHAASPTPGLIPAITFLNREFAFSLSGDLMKNRLPTLECEFDNQELHGSDADPRFPLYFNVLIDAAELRGVSQADDDGEAVIAHSATPPLLLLAQPAVAEDANVTPPPAKRKAGGTFSYEKQDAPLIAEMHRLIESGTKPNPHRAAWAIVDKAAGRFDAPVSKVARLCAGYKKAHRTVQN